jgi:tetratricopeptide (TPR) repeat protein
LSFQGGLAPQTAYAEASRAAQQALTLNDGLPETQLALAAVRHRFERDWAGAERAIALDPNSVAAHTDYGMLLSLQGRPDEALEHVQIATSLDPLSARARWMVATVLLYGRKYEACIQNSKKPCSWTRTTGRRITCSVSVINGRGASLGR